MDKTVKGNMLIAQSGGPTAVVNASLVAAVREAREHPEIAEIYGARNGLKGALEQDLINLRLETGATLNRVAQTPGSALGSCRKKPASKDCGDVFKVCQAHGVRYFFYIGGNDSAEAAHIINEASNAAGYELRVFHIPKTIDNDLRENDHTPGYGSAARYVALEFIGFTNDQRSLSGIHLVQVMGRHAGFLTAASVLGKRDETDAPHLVYIPEVPFSVDNFVSDVLGAYRRYGTCVAAISEGATTEDGTPLAKIAANALYGKAELLPKDSHNNIQLSGIGVALDYLLCKVVQADGSVRVRTDRLTYSQRTHPAVVSEVDREEAALVGSRAVIEAIRSNQDGSIAIARTGSSSQYGIETKVVPLSAVARETRSMPPEFYNAPRRMPTPAFVDYASDLIGKLPEQGRLEIYKVGREMVS